ncbi:MAG: hypothetical protein IT389_12430 [Nitrospira sp.]|nr:hypothetical protein [Nitrospira sp.]
MSIVLVMLGLLLAACAEGRWEQAGKSEAHTQADWDTCKREVLSGQEHAKETLAGGINLSGCMQSKGYHYDDEQLPRSPSVDAPAVH